MSDLKRSILYAEMLSILNESWNEEFTSKWGCDTAQKIYRKGYLSAMDRGYMKFRETSILCMKEVALLAREGKDINYQRIFNERFWREEEG